MIIPQSYKYNSDLKISDDEYRVINQFLAFYRNQSVIVADNYREDFGRVPLETDYVTFKTNEEWKSIDFCKRIFYKEKPYVVELGLWRVNPMEDDPKCLSMHKFRIITNGKVHSITLDTEDVEKRNILFNIISIFDEKKIIPPEQAYSKQMYNNKALQGFIKNHEWQNIDTGIKQMPELANALFIIKENFETTSCYTADFGTILYQLISFRMNNLKDFDEKDLKQLDNLILQLRETQLLKVQLNEDGCGQKSWPTKSILLESNNHDGRMHISKQYTVDNTELLEEQKTLNKCISNLTPKHK